MISWSRASPRSICTTLVAGAILWALPTGYVFLDLGAMWRFCVFSRSPALAPCRSPSAAAHSAHKCCSCLFPLPLPPAVTTQHVEIVLTAHPTQVNRRTLQHKHSRIAALLAQNDRRDLTQEERDETIEQLIR